MPSISLYIFYNTKGMLNWKYCCIEKVEQTIRKEGGYIKELKDSGVEGEIVMRITNFLPWNYFQYIFFCKCQLDEHISVIIEYLLNNNQQSKREMMEWGIFWYCCCCNLFYLCKHWLNSIKHRSYISPLS